VLSSAFTVLLAIAASPGTGGDVPRSAQPAAAGTTQIGSSREGRPIRALRVGRPRARIRILVVGEIHGNETAGKAVTRALRQVRPPRGVALWLIDSMNPDGALAGTRQNAAGVDLNRNFPTRWRPMGAPFGTYHSGPSPLSEPESRAHASFVRRLRPRVTIYYHQMKRLVDHGGGDRFIERLYSRRSGLKLGSIAPPPGAATVWQSATFPRDTPFVVELPAGSLSRASTARHRGAVLSIARALAPRHERALPIPFGAERRAQMRAYAKRHYGIDDFRLRAPRLIVQHYTASNSFSSAFNTFAQNAPDVSFGELPGVCAHYLIDRDGTVAKLVPTTLMCRHTVGLNHTAIGIEHVGTSDGQVLANRRQLRASLRLTRELQGHYRIPARNVIGHNESLVSPFYRERVKRFRGQTHGDFAPPAMRRYRSALRALPSPDSVRP